MISAISRQYFCAAAGPSSSFRFASRPFHSGFESCSWCSARNTVGMMYFAHRSIASLFVIIFNFQCSMFNKSLITAAFVRSRHLRQYGWLGMSGSIHGQNATAFAPQQHLQSDAFTTPAIVFLFFSLTFITPAVQITTFYSFSMLVSASVMMKAHRNDGKSRSVLSKKEEILAQPPSEAEPNAKHSYWKKFHSFC